MSSWSWRDPSFGQKAAHRFHRAFVGFLSGMRPVKYGPHTVQCNAHTRPFALADFPTAGHEQSLNVAPSDCSLNWRREHRFKGRLVFSAQSPNYHFSVSFQGGFLPARLSDV